MFNFNKAPEAIRKFTQEQVEARRKRLEDPVLEAKLEDIKTNLKEDVRRSAETGLDALYRFTLAGPLKAILEGAKTLGSVATHNLSNTKKKRNWGEIPAKMITELLSEYAKGVVSTTKFAGNVSLALSRTTVLGARYAVGK